MTDLLAKTIDIQVNGKVRSCSAQLNLPQLLEEIGVNPRLVAIEYNGEILHRQFWQADDRLEIVTIVGGG
jgi:sulfur carrier protein